VLPVDVIILGGSHAGLSTVATLCRHQTSIIIFDNQRPRNAWHTPMRAITGWEGGDLEDLLQKSPKEITITGLGKV